MNPEEDLQSLLVQVAKLQVALRKITSERDTLKIELAGLGSSQQQCLQLLLKARQQLQQFQAALGTVRESNEQLVSHNHRLQQQVQQLQQQDTIGSSHHQHQQLQSQTADLEQLDNFHLLTHPAAGWDSHKSTISSRSSSNSSVTSCCSSGTGSSVRTAGCSSAHRWDTASDKLNCVRLRHGCGLPRECGSQQHHTADDGLNHPRAALSVGQLGVLLHAQHEQLQLQTASQGGRLTAQQPQQGLPSDDAVHGLHLLTYEAPVTGVSAAASARISAGMDELTASDNNPDASQKAQRQSQQQQLPYTAGGGEVDAAGTQVVQLTQQQLDFILAEIANLQQKLVHTAAKLDAASPQSMTPELIRQHSTPVPAKQQQRQQRPAAHVPLQVGDQSISQWYQQLKLKQQQLHSRQQQLLGLEQPSQLQVQQAQAQQRLHMAANSRRHQQRQQQHGANSQESQQGTPGSSRVHWNYQNRQLQQQLQQRRWQSGIRLRASTQQMPKAADPQVAQEHVQDVQQMGFSAETQQQHLEQQQQDLQQQQRGLVGVLALQGSADRAAAPLEEQVAAPAAEAPEVEAPAVALPAHVSAGAASSCAQPEDSWVSSSSNDHGPAAGSAAHAAGAVVFMQMSSSQGPGIVRVMQSQH